MKLTDNQKSFLMEMMCQLAEKCLMDEVSYEDDRGNTIIPDLQDEKDPSIYKEKYQDIFNNAYDDIESKFYIAFDIED
jgi:hypothetical protein